MTERFQQEIERLTQELQPIRKQFKLFGYLKLVLVLFLCYFGYEALTNNSFFGVIFLVVLGISVYVWIKHVSLEQSISKKEQQLLINQNYIKRIDGTWIEFSDIGEEFIDYNHEYSSDLDIVGRSSIFQLLNSTNTYYGRKRFSEDLTNSHYSKIEIENRQQAIQELKDKLSFTTEIQCSAKQVGTNKNIELLVTLLQEEKKFIKIPKVILLIMPTLLIGMGILTFVFKNKIAAILFFGLILIHAGLWGYSLLKGSEITTAIVQVPHKLSGYRSIIEQIQKEQFHSIRLQEMQNRLTSSTLQAMKELDRIVAMIRVHSNPFIYFIVGIVLLWDYHCIQQLIDWQKKYSDQVEEWFLIIGELESLISFSVLPNVCDTVCIPKIIEQKRIQGVEVGHPLIPNEKRVANQIDFMDEIDIISGSNMSGKTTFIRTIGINCILVNAGSYVCAKEFQSAQFEIVTSMRIRDDLNEGISTFYAELKRIKKILEQSSKNEMTYFLIDEIFRGTNSVDRLEGAKKVLEKLDNYKVMGFITTHDLELGNLEKEFKRIKNYSFSETYQEDEIIFTYHLQKGVSTSTNARFLMKKLGILSNKE